MLDIVILYFLCKSIGKTIRDKGRQPLGYQIGAVVVFYGSWIVGVVLLFVIMFVMDLIAGGETESPLRLVGLGVGLVVFFGMMILSELTYFMIIKRLSPIGDAAAMAGDGIPAAPDAPPPPYMLGPPVEFKAAGADGKAAQGNLIVARNVPAFPMVKELFADAMTKRAAIVMLDYQQQAVGVRYEVDGVWHNMGQRDRPTADAMLGSMKKLADLEPGERRLKQQGSFKVEFFDNKIECSLTSQGVKTGERVMLKLIGKTDHLNELPSLGMRQKMLGQLTGMLNDPGGGLILVSAAPGQGLTTSFAATLRAADRFTRDFVGFDNVADPLPYVENINMMTFDKAAGQTPNQMLPGVLLKQPEAFVLADMVNQQTVEILCDQVNDHGNLVVASIQANESVEAFLRVLAMKAPADKFAKAIKAVVYTRLARRLCETCRQPYQPTPQLLQKLGLPPGRVNTLYRQWEPPPPEELVDEKGRPIPAPVCPSCSNLGYLGRFGLYELLVVDNKMRQALARQPKVEVLRRVAAAAGHRSLQEEGIAAAARGTTSLNEIQRVLK